MNCNLEDFSVGTLVVDAEWEPLRRSVFSGVSSPRGSGGGGSSKARPILEQIMPIVWRGVQWVGNGLDFCNLTPANRIRELCSLG